MINRKQFGKWLQYFGIVLIVVYLVMAFSQWTFNVFTSMRDWQSVSRAFTAVFIIAIGILSGAAVRHKWFE